MKKSILIFIILFSPNIFCQKGTLNTGSNIDSSRTALHSEKLDTVQVRIVNSTKEDSLVVKLLMILLPSIIVAFFSWLLSRNQSYRNTFFELLNQQKGILDNIEITIGELNEEGKIEKHATYKGIQYFEFIERKMHELYRQVMISKPSFYNDPNAQSILEAEFKKIDLTKDTSASNSKIEMEQMLKSVYDIQVENALSVHIYGFVFKKYSKELRKYFRHLFNIIKFIDQTNFLYGKQKLINFIQARMSDSELFVLFYNGLIFPKMHNYINTYNLIDNLTKETLLNADHEKFYNVKLKSNRNEINKS